MKLDARFLGPEIPPYDLCIIGSGPAGFTVALELLYTGLRVCVIEAGSVGKVNPDDDAAKAVESHGISIRPDSRQRVLGGSSEAWSGYLAPLDPIDFEPRPGIHDGWPISGEEISRFIDAAGRRYSLPAAAAFEPEDRTGYEMRAFGLVDKPFMVQSPPLRYGKAFAHVFLGSDLDLIHDATVTELVARKQDGSCAIGSVRFRDREGNEHSIVATKFVLAASAIESIRIVLNSETIEDPYDQFGRYFMNHPKGNVASVYFSKPLPRDHSFFSRTDGKFGHYTGIRLSEDAQRKEGLLNSYVRLELAKDSRQYPKAEALSGQFKRLKRKNRKGAPGEIRKAVAGILGALPGLPELIVRTAVRISATVKERGARSVRGAMIRCFSEMEPEPDNRVQLSDMTDRSGVRLPRVVHKQSELSVKTADRLLSAVERMFAAKQDKVVRKARDLTHILNRDASHHLGGLRMGIDPKSSVVDTELKFHGIDNLYAAGGAVFPTGGGANPTPTIIGLSIRLAETIGTALGRRSMDAPERSGTAVPFLVIGAGRRVREDVVPAIERLKPGAYVSGIYATSRSALFGLDRVYDVEPLSTVTADAVSSARFIYVAVPTKMIESALKKLTTFDCSDKTLIIDTPVLPDARIEAFYRKFARVAVGEDSAYLPWVELLVGRSQPITDVTFDRSGFAYHAVALAKAILAENAIRPAVARHNTRANETTIQFGTEKSSKIIGPRDYDRGTITFTASDGSKIRTAGTGDHVLSPTVRDGRCLGFHLGADSVSLPPEDVELAGYFSPEDTIVSRMLDIKRVGLRRLLADVVAGNPGYTIAEGLEDARVARS